MSARFGLFPKYALLITALVNSLLVASGGVSLWFSYRENEQHLVALQVEKAQAAATRIEQYVAAIEQQLSWTAFSGLDAGTDPTEQRRIDYLKLLRQVPAITEVMWIDPAGREQLRVSRLAMDSIGSGADHADAPMFTQAVAGKVFHSPVWFRKETEPYMTIARRAGGAGGVSVVDVNLKFVWEVVSRIQIGRAGLAYVVDDHGTLIAHPDISLVLKKTDLSRLPQVASAIGRAAAASAAGESPLDAAHDPGGVPVLAADARIPSLGWTVFVESPRSEAFAPLHASLLRMALVLAAGLVLSVIASFVLARRLVRPIRALQDGAVRVGAGELDHRIELKTRDEIQALGEQFNLMANALKTSYAELEAKVQQRTAELHEKTLQLEAANRHKSEFLANMSHELRTPLNAIIGFSEVLIEQMFGDVNAKQMEYLRDIHSSGQHLLQLINDVLDLSKIEAGRMELELSCFDLGLLLENSAMLVRERALRHGLTLTLDVGEGLDEWVADARKVKQAVVNLLSNAVKFTANGGHVTVRARRLPPGHAPAGDWAEVAVTDTGVGIRPEDQALVFEEFRQASGDVLRKGEGTGLGLALVKRFVELHGGTVDLHSVPGAGSTFTLHLPLGELAAAR